MQIRWGGGDHRRLSSFHCVCLQAWMGRNGDRTLGICYFIFLGTSPRTVHSFKIPLLLRLYICPFQCWCVMRKCLETVTFAWERRSVGWAGGGRGNFLGARGSVIQSESLERTVRVHSSGRVGLPLDSDLILRKKKTPGKLFHTSKFPLPNHPPGLQYQICPTGLAFLALQQPLNSQTCKYQKILTPNLNFLNKCFIHIAGVE